MKIILILFSFGFYSQAWAEFPCPDKLVNDYDNQKTKHLEKLADKMLEDQEKLSKLRDKKSDGKFLDLF